MQKFPEIFVWLISLIILSGCSQSAVKPGKDPASAAGSQPSNHNVMVVYKSPFCLCCKAWMKHLENNAFSVQSENSMDTASVKQQRGIPYSMQSCHTGVWNNQYVFEGHVPARLIRRYLASPPENSIGLAVPGMPKGAPGMHRVSDKDFKPYNVFLIQPNGQYQFYETVNEPEKI